MPTGVNKYNIKCKRCKVDFVGKMGSQKYCIACGHHINRVRRRGFLGNWTKKREIAFWVIYIKNKKASVK